MKLKNRILSVFLMMVFSISIIVSSIEVHASVTNDLKVHFIDVGQADSILIQQGSNTMLIDGGNNEDSTLVKNYISKLGIKKLDVVVGTHKDEDHIGGLDVVINSFQVGKVYFPKQTTTTKTFIDFVNAVKNKKLGLTVPTIGQTFKVGNATATVLAPNSSTYQDANDYSIVLKVQYGNNSFLFTGDAESVSEAEMVKKNHNLKADVLKVGHHGSKSSTSQEFLDKVNPKYAVISVGKGNEYGHPTQDVLTRLKNKNVSTYRTDQQGTIIATSNGTNITFNTKPVALTTPTQTTTATVTAKLDNVTPAKYSTINLTVTGVVGAKVTAVCNYKTTKTTYSGTIASNGKVVLPIKIGGASSGYSVVIDISVVNNGKTTSTQTSFTPK